MKNIKIAGSVALAAVLLLSLCALSCNSGPTKAGNQIVRIEYERPLVPCPTCPDEPWPYVVVYQHSLMTGAFQRIAENTFVAPLEVPENIQVSLNVNDRMMFDGVNECSWNEVGENIKVNGYPVHINYRDCAAPWAGTVKIIVHPDGSVSQID